MRFLYWALSSFYVFVAATVAIALLKPGPTELQVMRWMEGMMSAMHNSLMGASMDNSEVFSYLFRQSGQLSLLMIFVGIEAGLFLKIWRKRK
ncbi:hypothetical protein [Thermincola ferriacetica]|uniref:hypothetical protein n=1 Tax=Thermincola ferriacetica TaxID=281456 RepID=UPI00068CEE14|nr:hypothetical protein [Thermincola ferriacetica]